MQKFLVAAIEAALFIAFIILARRAWLARSKSHKLDLPILSDLDLSDAPLAQCKAFYVATTERLEPNNRVNASGLGHRGLARALVYPFGLVILRKGEPDLIITRDAVDSIGTAEYAIDKGVENAGLVSIAWSNNNLELRTFLRIANLADRREILTALQSLDREAIQ